MHCHEAINNIMGSGQVQKKAELFKFLLKYSEINAASSTLYVNII